MASLVARLRSNPAPAAWSSRSPVTPNPSIQPACCGLLPSHAA